MLTQYLNRLGQLLVRVWSTVLYLQRKLTTMSNPMKMTTPAEATRRLTRVSRTNLSIILLFLSWPVVLVHRYWNHRPPLKLNLIAFEDVNQDIQWYIKDTGDLVSITLILASFYVYVASTMKIVVGSFLLISIIDIWHYWLWYKRNPYVLWVEFGILIVAGLLMMFKYKNRP
jgi:hypothetical protein